MLMDDESDAGDVMLMSPVFSVLLVIVADENWSTPEAFPENRSAPIDVEV